MLRLLLLFIFLGGLSCSKDQPPTAPAGKKTGGDLADMFDAFDALQAADGDTAADSTASAEPDSSAADSTSASAPDSSVFSPTGKIRTTKVDPPRSVRIEKGEGRSVDIRWSAPASDAGFSGRYNVQFKRRSHATYKFSYETEARTYNAHVMRDTTYDYRVRSLAAAGWTPSDWVTTEYTLTGVAVENSARGAPANAAVTIPDEALRRYLEKALKKNRGATITHADMRKIVNLLEGHGTFQGFGYRLQIKSLVGLEAATNLQNVAMHSQQISDVSPLANLPKLRYLDLRGNPFLNDVSINEHVPALQNRGVKVVLSPYERTFPDSPFDIELVFLDDFTEVEKKIVRQAANRWESAIQADIPDHTFSEPQTIGCGFGSFFTIPAGDHIDDLRIYVAKFSGGGDTPRAGGHIELVGSSGFPTIGCIKLNEQKLSPNRPVELWKVALHEIGHALGIGILTRDSDMFHNRGTADAHFAGPQAIAAFDQAGGTNYQGAKVPMIPNGIHWHYDVLAGELMGDHGSFRDLSAITLGALSDLGYTVDFSMADPYKLPPLGAAKPVADAVPFCSVERLPRRSMWTIDPR